MLQHDSLISFIRFQLEVKYRIRKSLKPQLVRTDQAMEKEHLLILYLVTSIYENWKRKYRQFDVICSLRKEKVLQTRVTEEKVSYDEPQF